MRAIIARVLTIVLALAIPASAGAQSNFARPALDWMTLRTRYFDIHYPAPMAEWTFDLASRVDAVHDAVSALVGYAPRERITLVVEDPLGLSNGFANPQIDDPLIVLWPTPPDPSAMLGAYRDWPELLAVHEFAHIAHLVRPSRSRSRRLLWRVLPLRLGPIAVSTPRWATEGYATYIEGRLTGSGRPHGAARAAYLRQWALEGKLPTYAQLSASRDFAGGAMAYLAGSAFLEWLVAQHGDSSLVAVWRRLSARQQRSFDQAFAGVFGAPPEELYGRFTVDVTRRALAAWDTLAAAGLDTGVLVQRRRWATGDPAISADGRFVAVELPNRNTAGPLVVWRSEERVDTTRERRARERLLELDPEDVPAVPGVPRPKVPIATLRPMANRPFQSPRFFADTTRLLVTHDDALGDGAYRADLYEWNFRTGALRRITHGASLHDADPLPDGRAGIAVRCENGLCDLVRVDLTTGNVTVLRRATPATPFYRPRVSPDGRTVVVSTKQAGRWRLALVPVDPSASDGGAEATFLDPDDGANRYDASFIGDGSRIVCVSDAGGIPNLEIVDVQHRSAVPLTRVASAVSAPEPNPADSTIWFRALHARGMDLRRVSIATNPRPVVALPPLLAPAVPLPLARADTFARAPLAPPRPYGAGPHQHRLLPGGSYSAEGGMATLSVIGVDPVGRFAYALSGGIGERSTWRGGSLTASWRGTRPVVPGVMNIDGTLFHAEQRPSEQRALGDRGAAFGTDLDATLNGMTLATATARDYGQGRFTVRVGANLSTIDRADVDRGVRGLAFAEGRVSARARRGGFRTDLALGAHGARGATDGLGWARAIGTLTADLRTPVGSGRIDATLGMSDGGGGVFERFALGGWTPTFVDAAVMSQRLPMPALPVGFAVGRHVATLRASTAIGPLRPYYWIASTQEDFDRWARVAGVDVEYAIPSYPAFAIPAVVMHAGAAYSWDEPFRHRVGVFVGVAYRP